MEIDPKVKEYFESVRSGVLEQLKEKEGAIQKVPRGSKISVNCQKHGENVLGLVAPVGEDSFAVFCLGCLQEDRDIFSRIVLGGEVRPVAYVEVTDPEPEAPAEKKTYRVGLAVHEDTDVDIEDGILCVDRIDASTIHVYVLAADSNEAGDRFRHREDCTVSFVEAMPRGYSVEKE